MIHGLFMFKSQHKPVSRYMFSLITNVRSNLDLEGRVLSVDPNLYPKILSFWVSTIPLYSELSTYFVYRVTPPDILLFSPKSNLVQVCPIKKRYRVS